MIINPLIYSYLNLDLFFLELSEEQLLEHYIVFGSNENRIVSEEQFLAKFPSFDWQFYKYMNEDLVDYNIYMLMGHYFAFGFKEGRFICENDFYHYYPNFDLQFYKNFYHDLTNYNKYKLMKHYFAFGFKEERFICENDFYHYYPNFDLQFYKNFYHDLIDYNKYRLMSHYYYFGFKEGRLISDKNSFDKYPNLFHKYLLNLSNPNEELSYNIINDSNDISNFIITHIHIYDICLFDKIFGLYFDNLCEFSPIIITFCIGSISSDLLNKNISLLHIPNRGMDIGGKLCVLDYIEKKNISYDYLFFLHSKSNKTIRDSYFLPFLKNSQRLQLLRILLSINNNNLYGIFHPNIHSCDFTNVKILDFPLKYNKLYLTECLHFMNIDFDYYSIFSEGNVCILHKTVLNNIFKNKIKLFYNILNNESSFDYNWVKINYNLDTNLNETYSKYIQSNWNGNVLSSGDGIRDGMTEHLFERLWIKVIQHMKGNFLLLNEDNIFDTFQIKLNAIYFPQFHNSPENNDFWGDGFTEWTLLEPFQNNFKLDGKCFDVLKPHSSIGYYNLDNEDTIKNQIKIAEKYNINGFVIYHYWFKDNKKVLYKPLEFFLRDDIHFPFCISWANESWSRRWDGTTNDLLLEQTYGNENDFLIHIQYLIPFFLKNNYMKNEKGECIFYIYNFNEIKLHYNSMMTVWNDELVKYDLKIDFIITENSFRSNHDFQSLPLTKFIFEPMYSSNYVEYYNYDKGDKYLDNIKFENFDFEYYKKYNIDTFELYKNNLYDVFRHFLEKGFFEKRLFRLHEEINYFSINYEDIIQNYKNLELDNYQQLDEKHLGLPLYWNNKVRRRNRYFLHVKNADKLNISYLFNILICRIMLRYVNVTNILDIKKNSCNFININAWNEWNEQAVLEPNSSTGFENLKLIYAINHDL
jgi:hypothetical protein